MENQKENHSEAVIRIVKKKNSHGGHHGGAWKVAYADFVTSMMALFIVLWIMGQDEDVKKAVAGYFKDPIAFMKGSSVSAAAEGVLGETAIPEPQIDEKKEFEKIVEIIRESLEAQEGIQHLQDQVEIKLEPDGMKFELQDTTASFFFDVGTADLKPDAVSILTVIAAELGILPNKVVIEGHTDSRQYAPGNKYTNFELSTDRANSARRILVENGVKPEQVIQVTGYADSNLRNKMDPYDDSNRRISIKVRYTPEQMEAESVESKESKASGH